jgi:hypothetical protein
MKYLTLLIIISILTAPSAEAMTRGQRFIISAILMLGGAYVASEGAKSVVDRGAVYGQVDVMHLNIRKNGSYSIYYTRENEMLTQPTWKRNSDALIGLGMVTLTAGCGLMATVVDGSVRVNKRVKFSTRQLGF